MERSALFLVTALVRIAVPALFPITNFGNRFRRVWVTQELVNALTPVIHCGDLQIDWRTLWLAARVFQSNSRLMEMGLTFSTYRIAVDALEGANSYFTIADMRLRFWGYMSPAYVVTSWALGGDDDDQAPARLLSQRGLRPHEKFPIRRVLSALLKYERLSRPNALRARTTGNIFFNAKDPEILDMLNSTRVFLATNPVDRMYALLGLVRNMDLNDPDFRIEYSAAQSPPVVCQRFAAGMIKRGRGAAVLGLAGATRQACQTVAHGPSWVPDWTTPIRPNNYVMSLNLLMHGQNYADKDFGASYYAAGPSTMNVGFEDAGGTLVIRGTLFDTLVHITRGQLFAPPNWYLKILQDFAGPGMDAAQIEETLWRTLIANQTSKGEEAPPEMAVQYQAYKERARKGVGFAAISAGTLLVACLPFLVFCVRRIGWVYLILAYLPIWFMGWDGYPLHTTAAIIQLCNYSIPVILIGCCIVAWRAREFLYAYMEEADLAWQYLSGFVMAYNPAGARFHNGPPACSDFMETFLHFAGRHNLGITAVGYVGLFPLAARPGDKVMILEGGHTPFLLRPVEEDGTFTLVGECYVHGIMKGEAWEKASTQLEEVRII